MRRVLLTVHKFFPGHRAGTEVLTLKVAQELKRRSYDVLVFTANPPDTDARRRGGTETSYYEYEGIPVYVIEEPLRLKDYRFSYEYDHPLIAQHFRTILHQFKPSIVHSFHCQNLSASVIHEAIRFQCPIVLSPTDFWFVCPIVQLKRTDGSLCMGPNAGATNCLTCYTPKLFAPINEVSEALEQKYLWLSNAKRHLPKPLVEWSEMMMATIYNATKCTSAFTATVKSPEALRTSANAVAAIMVPTKLMAEVFTNNGINSALLHHVPFGIDTASLLDYREKTKSDILRIGFIGTIFEHKGLDILIQAFQGLLPESKACLKIYGDMNQFPAYAEQIRQLVRDKPVYEKQIKFCGTFPNEQLGRILKELDVLVVPSRWYENTPLVVQSAFATKTPVIATDLGGLSELVLDGINGFLFELNDVKSLRSRIECLLENPLLLEHMRANIKEERTIIEMVNDIESVYNRVLSCPSLIEQPLLA